MSQGSLKRKLRLFASLGEPAQLAEDIGKVLTAIEY
jgi:hypothetical protein